MENEHTSLGPVSGELVKESDLDTKLFGVMLTQTGMKLDELGTHELTYSEWYAVGSYLNRVSKAFRWWVGDWLNYAETRKELSERIHQAASIFEQTDSTLQLYASVAKKVPYNNRRSDLSWSMHHAVAPLTPSEQVYWLGVAAPNASDKKSITTRELSSMISTERAKKMKRPLEETYRCIVADIPWGRMPMAEIRELNLHGLAAPDGAHLFIILTQRTINTGLELVKRWHFKFHTMLCCVGQPMPRGLSWAQNARYCIFAVKDKLGVITPGLPSGITSNLYEPTFSDFIDITEKASPGPRILVSKDKPNESMKEWDYWPL